MINDRTTMHRILHIPRIAFSSRVLFKMTDYDLNEVNVKEMLSATGQEGERRQVQSINVTNLCIILLTDQCKV